MQEDYIRLSFTVYTVLLNFTVLTNNFKEIREFVEVEVILVSSKQLFGCVYLFKVTATAPSLMSTHRYSIL